MISLVDYGVGNIQAFVNVYKRLNMPVSIAKGPDDLSGATKVILPGVGHFDHAMEHLEASGMRPELDAMVARGTPVLGVCVGMQLLGTGSDEGVRPGLNWIPGQVRAFSAREPASGLPLPHMGWNDVRPVGESPLFDGLTDDARFYFLHSFYFDCAGEGDELAVADYGGDFACAVRAGNVYGVQFHPEKSHEFGTRLLKNFADL